MHARDETNNGLAVCEIIDKSSLIVENQQAKGPSYIQYDTNTRPAREVPSMLYCEMYHMTHPIVLY